jgi:flagellar biosynthesis component FlhA
VESIEGTLAGLQALKLPPVLVCSGLIRTHLRNLIVRKSPMASVLAYEEVADDFRLEVHGTVALERVT